LSSFGGDPAGTPLQRGGVLELLRALHHFERHRKIALAMLVVFRKFFQRPGPARAARGRRFCDGRQSRFGAPQAPLQGRDCHF
jgi:hypothetical protein